VGWVAQLVQRLATGWTVRGSNPGGDEILRTCPDRPWGPPSLLYNWYRVFPGGKERLGRDVDPSPPSSAAVMKGYSYTSTTRMGRTACTEPQFLYKGWPLPFFNGFSNDRWITVKVVNCEISNWRVYFSIYFYLSLNASMQRCLMMVLLKTKICR
jgi:hypothetical protein